MCIEHFPTAFATISIIIFLFQSSAGEFLAASNFMIGQMPDVQSISEIVFQLGTTVVIQMKSYLQLV